MNNINIKEALNDEEYVSTINEVSTSIFKYYKATKGNYSIIENNYDLLINKYNNIPEVLNIIKIYLANNENLENFISDMKILFQKLRLVRKEYLSKISNYISKLSSKAYNNKNLDNNFVMEKNRYLKIINLLTNLNKYKDIIEIYDSQEQSQEFANIIMQIKNELKKTEIKINYNKYNNYKNVNNTNLETNDLKNKLKEFQRKTKELEMKNEELLKNNKIKENELIEKEKELSSLNEELKSIDIKFNDIIQENNKNKDTIEIKN